MLLLLDNDILNLRLYGDGIAPTTFSAREFGTLVTEFEACLKSYILLKNKELKAKEIFLSPIAIHNESLGMPFFPNVKHYFLDAFTAITLALTTNDFSDIPIKSVEHLKNVQTVVRVHNCKAQLILNDKPIAEFDGNTKFISNANVYESETIVYGIIRTAGGAEPSVRIEFDDKNTRTFAVSKDIAKQLGSKLYDEVGLRGIATWNSKTGLIEDLKITGLIEYAPTNVEAAFKEIQDVIGKYWDDVEDINNTLFND